MFSSSNLFRYAPNEDGGGDPPPTTIDFGAWIKEQPAEIQAAHTQSIEKLMSALQKERDVAKRVPALESDLAASRGRETLLAQTHETALADVKTTLQEATQKRDALTVTVGDLTLRLAIVKAASAAHFNDTEDAIRLIDRSKLELEGETVKGLPEALTALIQAKPYLVEKPAGDGLGNDAPSNSKKRGKTASQNQTMGTVVNL